MTLIKLHTFDRKYVSKPNKSNEMPITMPILKEEVDGKTINPEIESKFKDEGFEQLFSYQEVTDKIESKYTELITLRRKIEEQYRRFITEATKTEE